MALVEPRLLENLQQLQQHHPSHHPNAMLDNKLDELDTAMQDILNRKGVSQEKKLKLYHEILQKYLHYSKQVHAPATQDEPMLRDAPMIQDAPSVSVTEKSSTPLMQPSPLTINPDTADPIEIEIVQSAPKYLKKKASLLLRRIKQDTNMQWNDKGEFVYKGQVLPKTHIHDLVQDVLRKRKTLVPQGWQTFAQALKESNTPQDLVGNPDRWKWMNQRKYGADKHTPAERQQSKLTSVTDGFKPRMKTRLSLPNMRWTPYK